MRNIHAEDINLSAQSELSQTDPEGLNKCLEDTVNDIVERQQSFFDRVVAIFRGRRGAPEDVVVHGVRHPPRSFYTDKLCSIVRQPLIILRVETTGEWQLPNPTAFGQT